MPIKVVIMRFNANELGYRNGEPNQAGPFLLIKKEALKIEGFDPDEDEIPIYFNDNYKGRVTYKNPVSKPERRLSLSRLRDDFSDIQPKKVVCLYMFSDGTNPEGINIEAVSDDSVYVSLLEKYGSQYTDNKTGEKIRNYLVSDVTISEPISNSDLSNTVCLPKPFLLLAGISGTGKTRFVKEQAALHDSVKNNFCLVPVRPDWHEPSDLLGYVSRTGVKPKYVSTKVLDFIIRAWRSVAPNADENGLGEFNLKAPPYWLCLDEMNLAPVEQYFSDYLSVLESRSFEEGNYKCGALLDESILQMEDANVCSDLKMNENEGLWKYFLVNGIPIPPNLIVAGTVNMDETTHGFSRKVIDRALTIDFGEFFPNDYDKIFDGQNVPKPLTYSLITQVTQASIDCDGDPDGTKTIEFLKSVNAILKGTPFELAYRALNELLLYVSSFKPDDDASLQAVWDDFLMTKVLPRVDGDEDKLRTSGDSDSNNLLEQLEVLLEKSLSEIWDDDKSRVDFFSVQHDSSEINDLACRSRKKIRWMKERLESNTFTSYWP